MELPRLLIFSESIVQKEYVTRSRGETEPEAKIFRFTHTLHPGVKQHTFHPVVK